MKVSGNGLLEADASPAVAASGIAAAARSIGLKGVKCPFRMKVIPRRRIRLV